MGDKIYIDTELLRQISSQLSQVHHSLSGIQQKLSNSVSEVRGVVSDQVGLINVLSAVQKNTQKDSDYTERLAKAVNNAAARWEEVERRLANQQLQGSEAAPQGTGGGAGTGIPTWMDTHKATWMGALIGTALGGPFGIGIGMGIGAAMDARANPAWKNGWNTAYDFLTGKTDFEVSGSETEIKNGEYTQKTGWNNLSFKTKGQAGYEYENEKWQDWDKQGAEFGASLGIEAEISKYQVEKNHRGKDGEWSGKLNAFGAAGSGEVGLTLFDKDGKFDPQGGVKAKAEVYAAKAEVSGKYGSDDLNAYAGAQLTAAGMSAEGKAGYFRNEDGTKTWQAKAEWEVYLAKAEVKTGVDIFGIKIGATGEAMIGISGKIGAEVGSSSVSGDVGFGPFKGKVMVDWGDFAQKYL